MVISQFAGQVPFSPGIFNPLSIPGRKQMLLMAVGFMSKK